MQNTETYNTLQKPEILFPTMKPLEKMMVRTRRVKGKIKLL